MILKNKGLFLETIINNSIKNDDYEKGYLIYKMPINSKLINCEGNIVKSILETNYFCDYIGIYNGFYIEFEAKETEKTYFNLNNIKSNQKNKMYKVIENKGIAFVLIYFHIYNEIFLIDANDLKNFNKTKIEYDFFNNNIKKINFDNGKIDFNYVFNHLISYT
ncbi:Holliday junction resolvase RecU [Spiroplasma turonicum]|uniref:Holliday junction resolvase RecU n=1 Tax=Spiroplasma turonicum TaxID=216946 RepID=A0A0K1P879_9MOLU|nr:Holliday junction resolvase RecU [Spiroplasma turonicum]AKU80102.1 Holliday junction-specific endonuclease [Spiroplasma turonicum]ALX71102.1 Holliday junction-specific endonuclease [Spiroplasma turonicum]